MKFVCENPDCIKFGIEDEYFTNTYKSIDGKMVSNNAPCPKCGKIRREINENANIPISEKNISIAEYSSLSPEDKKTVLKKRSHEHYKKEIKPLKEHKIQEAVKQFTEASNK